jgi:hypothetical protein
LGHGLKIGDLTSLEAKAYDGEKLLSAIRLKSESFTRPELADLTVLGGSFRSKLETDDYWNLEAFDGTRPTAVVVDYRTQDGKTYRIGVRDVNWADEGYRTVINRNQNAAYKTIQEAIVAATPGDNTIEVYPGQYGTAPIEIVQKDGVNIALVAKGNVVLKNQIKIDGDGRAHGTETLTIKGFTFDFSDSGSVSVISAQHGELGSLKYNYAHHLTIEDVQFIGNPSAEVVAIKTTTGSTFGLAIRNCQGIHLHSLGQLSVAEGFTVENCTVVDGESGINYYGDGDAVITNFTADVKNYGVRAGQSTGSVNANATLTISSSRITAKFPIWLRGDAPHLVDISDGNTLMFPEGGKKIQNDAGDGVTIIE